MTPPTNIDGTDITGATIDGQLVQEITVDGQTVFSPGPAERPPSGLAYLTLDDANTSGGFARDVWNDNDFSIDGATTGVQGANDQYITNEAYSFDGNDDKLDSSPLFSGPPVTLAAFISTTQSDNRGRLISNRNFSNSFDIISIFNEVDGVLNGFVRDGNGTSTSLTSTTTINDGVFHHIVLSVGNTTSRLFVDGIEEDSGSTPGGGYNINIARIGADARDATNNLYDGVIDDVRYYDKGLTVSEVDSLYNTGSIL
jgi:hypothetical protein